MVHTAYTLPRPTGTGCFIATSNGLASGNHLREAISHAICETVEREAATFHGRARSARPRRGFRGLLRCQVIARAGHSGRRGRSS